MPWSTIQAMWEAGKIQVYTGDGKGKTTASLGAAIRVAGAGLPVAIVYFDKGGKHYSERKILDQLKASGVPIEYVATGTDRIHPKTGVFRFENLPEDVTQAKGGLEAAYNFLQRKDPPRLLVLDEILNAIRVKLLTVEDVLSLLDQKPASMELILTGREIPKKIKDRADLITEMKLHKHYFYAGVKSREGIEW